MDPRKIMVAVPTRGRPDAYTVRSLQAIRDEAPGLPPILYESSRLSVCDGRNKIARQFLETDCEYLISVDDDIVPHRDLLGLADRGLDIVNAPVLIVREEVSLPFPNVFNWDEASQKFGPVDDTFVHVDRKTLLRCDGVGSGAICIARRVLEHPALAIPFQHRWSEHGTINMTEDLTFCLRARELDFEVWADYARFSDQFVNINITWLAQLYAAAMDKVRGKSYSQQSDHGLWLP